MGYFRWGAFESAKYTLLLTGTPIRSDGAKSVWLSYDHRGVINLTDEAMYTLHYGEAVDLNYCRPATFHRHEGHFRVDPGDGNLISVSGSEDAELTPELRRVPGLERALNFYKLACTPQFEKDGLTPLSSGYQASMIENAICKLDEIRHRMPDAGGLIIAPNIPMAEYMASLIEILEGEPAQIVHSQMPNPETKIKAFRKSESRWLVSVAMVSEGVDIKRLRVLVYLPNALTELAFRQAVGRVVRSAGQDDDTRAYVVMPSFNTFEEYARRIEDEMPAPVEANSGGRYLSVVPSAPATAIEMQATASNAVTSSHNLGEQQRPATRVSIATRFPLTNAKLVANHS